MDANSVDHQDIVKRLLDSKAVDFAAVGKALAEIGPTIALMDEPWEGFCGTMRTFFHCYRVPPPTTDGFVDDLDELNGGAGELGG